ncbi:hypothetical protein Pst134EA_011249 [Puccinia striiformis f. sp. tritici]|uniref:hypothetical protein n=1 Tax=Puccinia striiformis f. sp. tritici TaxID=168172 RepID=UPI000A123861|nr:hypothetical protein Pst134EA_011249 [Puccinia striiformis f. sp. tritici]KAH9467610.1 hypothetical protein Pst134EA_011249 [Puccinia striiformis f. sp. tritici]
MQFVNHTVVLLVLLAEGIDLISVHGQRVYACPSARRYPYCGEKRDDGYHLWVAFPEGAGHTCGQSDGIPYCCSVDSGYSGLTYDGYDRVITASCKQG